MRVVPKCRKCEWTNVCTVGQTTSLKYPLKTLKKKQTQLDPNFSVTQITLWNIEGAYRWHRILMGRPVEPLSPPDPGLFY